MFGAVLLKRCRVGRWRLKYVMLIKVMRSSLRVINGARTVTTLESRSAKAFAELTTDYSEHAGFY